MLPLSWPPLRMAYAAEEVFFFQFVQRSSLQTSRRDCRASQQPRRGTTQGACPPNEWCWWQDRRDDKQCEAKKCSPKISRAQWRHMDWQGEEAAMADQCAGRRQEAWRLPHRIRWKLTARSDWLIFSFNLSAVLRVRPRKHHNQFWDHDRRETKRSKRLGFRSQLHYSATRNCLTNRNAHNLAGNCCLWLVESGPKSHKILVLFWHSPHDRHRYKNYPACGWAKRGTGAVASGGERSRAPAQQNIATS